LVASHLLDLDEDNDATVIAIYAQYVGVLVLKQSFVGFTVVLALFASPARAETLSGIVIGVADGDTITVLDDRLHQHKVRLAGIDAPEKGQDFGQRSKQNLAAMAHGRQVMVEGHKIDRYGRFVGKVMVGGTDVNLRQIEMGLAWHYKAYEREQTPDDRDAYAAAENAAKGLRTGLWSLPSAQSPWEYRRRRATAPSDSLADPARAVLQ
jgi:endonuclease YncB( thermonuclease family)